MNMYENFECPMPPGQYGFPMGPGSGYHHFPPQMEQQITHYTQRHDPYQQGEFLVPAPPPYPNRPEWALIEQIRKRKSSSHLDYDSDDDDESRGSGDTKRFARQNHSEIEKRRRDKMNSYITELASMIPMCNAMNRKLDKLTVLRMAVQHMKTLRGSGNTYTETSHKPSFLSDDELKHLILGAADGFLFVVGCDRGRILYVSESVQQTLCYSQSDLIGQSFFDILHPRDIGKVKEQLSSPEMRPRERLIDAKTMLPVKTELPQKPTQLCSGARRSFFCRMKAGHNTTDNLKGIKMEKDPITDSCCSSRTPTERKTFSIIHCTGYLKSWSSSKLGLDEDIDGEGGNSSCLVAVGRIHDDLPSRNEVSHRNIKVCPMEYVSRHSIDGKFTYVDPRATIILGYLPQELLGTSIYEYYHQDDISELAETHRKVLRTSEKLESSGFRFRTKDGSFIRLRSKCFSFVNPWTKEVDFIVSTNTVVQEQEVSSSNEAYLTDGNLLLDDIAVRREGYTHEGARTSLTVPGVPGGTRAGAGRIGRQIAEEILERGKCSPCNADSSNENRTPAAMLSRSPAVCSRSPATICSRSPAAFCSRSPTVICSSSQMQAMDSPDNSTVHSGGDPIADIKAVGNSRHQTSDQILADSGLCLDFSRSGYAAPDSMLPDTSLIDSVMGEDALDILTDSTSDLNDEAAMAVIMSLLEADAGLVGPVDLGDMPWPL